MWSLVTTVLLVFGLGACAQRDNRTVLTVWSWEPSMRSLARGFEARNPDIRIVIKSTSGYENLNTAIEDGYGQPDVSSSNTSPYSSTPSAGSCVI